ISMADITKTVTVLEIQNPKFQMKILKNKDCKFGYRDSIFKRDENLIILSAEIELKKGNKKEIQKKIREYLRQPKENQPLEFPCAGSVFKNPTPHHFSMKSGGGSAGWLIEKSGLKGKKLGKVQISKKHANFIVNLGQGKAKDVLGLIKLAKEKVKEKFGIELKEEIEYL
ncbi:MAG: UDP-N-acetylenolpyruvoylglucosamine reductase, partial [Candidatus Aenigmarchaeota archaeon]|nr:UDP-N-acetylenolpyruvoylglucosamine reductase [Candidatus Aenigmarchaeota archaeon]